MSSVTLRRFIRQAHGQDLIEYALLAAFIAVFLSGATAPLGTAIGDWYLALAGVSQVDGDSAKQGGGDPGKGKGKKSNCSATGIAASKGKCQ